MSIKQQGGVFGRNPTFNDVTIEGTLTFDGDIDVNSDLKVDGDLDVTGSALIGTTTANTTYAPRLYTESALGDGNGGILIGSYKPSATFLDFSGGIPAVHRIANDGGNLYFETDTNQDGTFDTVGAHFTSIGNLAFASGKGIDFSATAGTGTSELLDDYEEGDWTANLTMTSGSVGYGSQLGKYVKVGNQVTANAWIYINSVSSPAGALSVALPFAIASTATRPASYVMNFNLTGVTGQTQGWVNPNTANLLLTRNDNGAGSSLDGANLQVGSELYISITYIV